MKKLRLYSALLLSVTTLVTFSSSALAGEHGSEIQSHGIVEFRPNSDPTDPFDPENPDPDKPVVPIDPTNPDKPVNPGTNGPLSIDFASSFDFGLNEISNKDKVYAARAQKYSDGHKDTPNYVQVTDNRGTNTGWTLTVKQDGQLKAMKKTLHDVLTGAEITLTDPTVTSSTKGVTPPIANKVINLDPAGTASVVMTAVDQSGAGTWETYWGKVETVKEKNAKGEETDVNVTKAVSLSVPGETPKDAVKYQTTLNWELTDAPGN